MKFERTPWGFIRGFDGRLVATTSVADRARRTELGETAIRLLEALGIETWQLEEMVDLTGRELVVELQKQRLRPSREQLEFPFAGDQP